MAEHARTVAHAAFRFTLEQRSLDGQLRRVVRTALRGDRVLVDDVDLARGELYGALIEGPLPAVPVTTVPVETVPTPAGPVASTDPAGPPPPADPDGSAEPERPPKVAAKGVWVEYAVAGGMDRDEAEEMTKDQLIVATLPG